MTHLGKKAHEKTRFEAEDRAISYLEKLPPDVAFATALALEFELGTEWAELHRALLRQGKNPLVFQISGDDFERMRTARTLLPPDVDTDWTALIDLRRMLRGLRCDQKWKAASTIACRACSVFIGQRWRLDKVLPELASTAPQGRGDFRT
jgi:hypothetical protein